MTETVIRLSDDSFAICDPDRYPDLDVNWFDRDWWVAEGARRHSITGRAPVMMLDRERTGGDETWVYRHYHRGGFVSKLIYDQYLWLGADSTRPVREWRLLAALSELDLPAPRPVAARAVRSGLFYRADILTVLLPDTQPLSSMLSRAWEDASLWTAIGRMLAGFHRAGCDHPDLTAHNVLVDSARRPFLVDFDNARLRPVGGWAAAGVARFKRSLKKVSLETGTEFDEAAWQTLLAAYSEVSA
jgi:3-deoxy-D-manno-octulosonic acid kinase